MSKEKQNRTVQTTGHAWDGDIQEFNNPLPTWWVWGFYVTVVFAIIYWFLYPAWPIGDSYTKGIGNEIEYKTADGKVVTTHWNTRALFEKDMQEARAVQSKYLAELKNASYQDILKDTGKREFAMSSAKVLFADNCAACHQQGGSGLIGKYPSLVDDDWIWGGDYATIDQTIRNGRKGNMPAFGGRFDNEQIADLAEYVLSFSGQSQDVARVKRGKALFDGAAGCYACHTKAGTGQKAMGSANLTDHIWTVADIHPKDNYSKKLHAIESVIKHGVHRVMPSWKHRFTDTEIKMLTLYVKELGSQKE